MNDLIARHGIPDVIVSDNGSQFTSSLFKKLCEQNGINHMFSAPYHPQSNGQAERFVDTLKRTINKAKGEGRFESALPKFLLDYRTTPSATLGGKSPAELFTGRRMKTRLNLMKPEENTIIYDVEDDPMKSQFDRKHGAVEREFEVDSQIRYRSNPEHRWIAGRIVRKRSKTSYEIELVTGRGVHAHPNQLRIRHGKPIPGLDKDRFGYSLLSWTFALPRGAAVRRAPALPHVELKEEAVVPVVPVFEPPPLRPVNKPPPKNVVVQPEAEVAAEDGAAAAVEVESDEAASNADADEVATANSDEADHARTEEDDEDVPTPPLRRSTRVRRPPERLEQSPVPQKSKKKK